MGREKRQEVMLPSRLHWDRQLWWRKSDLGRGQEGQGRARDSKRTYVVVRPSQIQVIKHSIGKAGVKKGTVDSEPRAHLPAILS